MSYIALMEAQRRPHSRIYSMPAKQFATGAEALKDRREIDARLRPSVAPVLRRPAPTPPTYFELDPGPLKPTRKPHDYILLYRKGSTPLGPRWSRAATEQILAEVAEKHGVSVKQITGPSRLREVVRARFEAFYRISDEMGYSLLMIGKAVGGKDHSGVLHGIRKHKAMLEAAGL